MLIPAPLNLVADWRGSVSFSLTLYDRLGAPIDASAASEIWFTAKINKTDLDGGAVVQVTKTGGGISVSGDDDNVINVLANDIGSILNNEKNLLYCDVKVKLSNGFIQVIAKGTLKISEVITQSLS